MWKSFLWQSFSWTAGCLGLGTNTTRSGFSKIIQKWFEVLFVAHPSSPDLGWSHFSDHLILPWLVCSSCQYIIKHQYLSPWENPSRLFCPFAFHQKQSDSSRFSEKPVKTLKIHDISIPLSVWKSKCIHAAFRPITVAYCQNFPQTDGWILDWRNLHKTKSLLISRNVMNRNLDQELIIWIVCCVKSF